MLRAVKKLAAGVKGRQFEASTAVFPDLDADGLISDLDPKAVGAERGERNTPPTEAAGLDSFETQVVDVANEHRRRGLNNYDQHMQVYAQRLARAINARARIETEAEKARTDFEASARSEGNHLTDLRHALRERSVEQARFRERHGLTERTARTPWHLSLTIGLVLCMIAGESVLNGYFFAQSNVMGLIGGASVAFVISVVNVVASMVLGWFSRGAVHIRLWRKLTGLAVGVAWCAFAGGFNLSVAHFRDAADGRDWNEAAVAALSNLRAAPFELQSIESWLLVLFGALISLIGFLKGIHLDDPYPGYGQVSRRLSEARGEYAAEVERANAELLEKRDDARDALEEAGAAARDEINEAVDVAYARQGLSAQRDQFLSHCEDVTHRILTLYREANVAARSTPAPAHFAQRHRFPAFEDAHDRDRDGDRAREAIARIETAVDGAVKAIFAAFDKALASHGSVDDVERGADRGDRATAASEEAA